MSFGAVTDPDRLQERREGKFLMRDLTAGQE
jgi:hypothetical protein